MNIFPINIPCCDQGGGSYAFRSFFMATRPKDIIWYGYDSIILSKTEVEFVIYDMFDDMFDNCRGGLGAEITRFKALVPESTTERFIERRILDLAMERRTIEIIAAEGEIVKRYADEIRAEIRGIK